MVETIMLIVFVVALIALMVFSYFKKKKMNTSLSDMRNDLKEGDKVLTDSGIVGEVVESFEEDGFKYFVLKSGRGQHMGYYTVHANSIYYVYGKDDADKTEAKKDESKMVEPKQEEAEKINKDVSVVEQNKSTNNKKSKK